MHSEPLSRPCTLSIMNNNSMNLPTNYNYYLVNDENHAQTISLLTGEKYGVTNLDGMNNVHVENGSRHIQADTLDTADLTIRAASALASLTNKLAQEEQQRSLSETRTASNEALQSKQNSIRKKKLKALPFPMKVREGFFCICKFYSSSILTKEHTSLC